MGSITMYLVYYNHYFKLLNDFNTFSNYSEILRHIPEKCSCYCNVVWRPAVRRLDN